jgi:hypothetical protein
MTTHTQKGHANTTIGITVGAMHKSWNGIASNEDWAWNGTAYQRLPAGLITYDKEN